MVEEKQQIIERIENEIDQGREQERELKLRLMREAERVIDDGDGHKGRSKGKGEKRGCVRAGRGGWEIRRKKGQRETPLGAMYETMFKRGMS